MASPFTPCQHTQKTPSSSATSIFPFSCTQVCLHKWWLTNTNKDSQYFKLGVGGFANIQGRGERVFYSAAIAKRRDANTLETVDGITVTITGFIDGTQTRQNGFPFKVCDHFLIGFPYDWEEYAAQYCGEKSSEEAVPPPGFDNGFYMHSSDGRKGTLLTSFDDLPVTRVHDLLMSRTNDSDYSAISTIIFNDILGKCGGDSVPDRTPRHNDETVVDQKHKDNICLYSTSMRIQETRTSQFQSKKGVYSTWSRTEESHNSQIQSEKRVDVFKLSKCVAIRNMIRSQNITNNRGAISFQLEDSKMQVKENQIICDMPKSDASNISHTNMLSGQEKEVEETPVESSVRRYKRHKYRRT